MNEKNEMVLVLPEETVKTLGIDEDTAFETYFEDGAIKIRVLDDDEIEEPKEIVFPEKCHACAWFCRKRGTCTLDD